VVTDRPRPKFSTESSLRGPGAATVLDEAASLLYRAPVAVTSIYYLGALPFCLALIYFWSDMLQGADAEAHLPGEALLLTILYLWMKTCQAVFARKLVAFLEEDSDGPWTAARWTNTLVLQAIFAGAFLFVYPVAFVATLPFGWVHCFYHSISIVATDAKSTVRSSFREAAELAGLWPKQNHLVIGIIVLAALVLYINLAVFFIFVPRLLEMLFGVETIFDENLAAWNNTSFYLEVSVFCFLVLNPLSKAVYALRCFYGRSRLDGADLRSALRRCELARANAVSGRALAVAALLAILFGAQARADMEEPSPTASSPPPAESVIRLNYAIDQTLKKDEFAWRSPRPPAASQPEGWLAKSLEGLRHFLKHLISTPLDWLSKFLKWLVDRQHAHETPNASDWMMFSRIPWRLVFFIFAGLVVLGIGYWLVRHLRRPAAALLVPQTVEARTIDLEAEDIRADELPEDSWLLLAQQMLERGELRLALRAYYLATLAVLAQGQWVRLAAAKSNRDYLTELRRRLRGNTEAIDPFLQNIRIFEASWYGTHPATLDLAALMGSNHERMRTYVAT
jgi:hypothetical protein